MAVAEPIIVIAHGSPDPDWRRPVQALEHRLRQLAPDRPVHVAYMEHAEPSLEEVAKALAEAGHPRAIVVAAFLSPGGRHIKRDLPELVTNTNDAIEGITLTLVPGALGEHPEVIDALAHAALGAAGAQGSDTKPK